MYSPIKSRPAPRSVWQRTDGDLCVVITNVIIDAAPGFSDTACVVYRDESGALTAANFADWHREFVLISDPNSTPTGTLGGAVEEKAADSGFHRFFATLFCPRNAPAIQGAKEENIAQESNSPRATQISGLDMLHLEYLIEDAAIDILRSVPETERRLVMNSIKQIFTLR